MPTEITVPQAASMIAEVAAGLEPAAKAVLGSQGQDEAVYGILCDRIRAARDVVYALEAAGGVGQTEELGELVRRQDFRGLARLVGILYLASMVPPHHGAAWDYVTCCAVDASDLLMAWTKLVVPDAAWGIVGAPIEADSDDGALFELLAQVGGRMPNA